MEGPIFLQDSMNIEMRTGKVYSFPASWFFLFNTGQIWSFITLLRLRYVGYLKKKKKKKKKKIWQCTYRQLYKNFKK